MALIINFIGSSCTGKSLHAHGLYSEMKKRGYKVEFVKEWVKDSFYKDNRDIPNQFLITGKQIEATKLLLDKVDYIITESPIVLGAYYSVLIDNDYALAEAIRREFGKFDNYNILLEKDSEEYDEVGRGSHNISKIVDEKIRTESLIPFHWRSKSRDIRNYTKLIKDIMRHGVAYKETRC
jgi:molybdopterin-guanine dinucleotide biosynthesis protein